MVSESTLPGSTIRPAVRSIAVESGPCGLVRHMQRASSTIPRCTMAEDAEDGALAVPLSCRHRPGRQQRGEGRPEGTPSSKGVLEVGLGSCLVLIPKMAGGMDEGFVPWHRPSSGGGW